MRIASFLLLLAAVACKTTSESREASEDGEEIHISANELEPMRDFLLQTHRILAAEYVRIEMTAQFFEGQMGHTRDPRYVSRRTGRTKDGARFIELRNVNEQKTNIDPDTLPRVYFGRGLEVRAYRTLVVIIRNPRDKERPLFLDIQAKSGVGNARLWVGGRLQQEKPAVHVRSELLWSPDEEEYVHRSSTG